MPLVFPQAVPSSMIDPRQSTTVPKVSKTSAFTGGGDPCARKANAAAPIPADITIFLRVMVKLLGAFYTKPCVPRSGDAARMSDGAEKVPAHRSRENANA